MVVSMISAGGRAALVLLRGGLLQGEILARQAACEASTKSSLSLDFVNTKRTRGVNVCIVARRCASKGVVRRVFRERRQEEPRAIRQRLYLAATLSIVCILPLLLFPFSSCTIADQR